MGITKSFRVDHERAEQSSTKVKCTPRHPSSTDLGIAETRNFIKRLGFISALDHSDRGPGRDIEIKEAGDNRGVWQGEPTRVFMQILRSRGTCATFRLPLNLASCSSSAW
jgi:hypothetical protein